LAEQLATEWEIDTEDFDFLTGVEKIALAALRKREFDVAVVKALLIKCKADFNCLYKNYIGKNVLNMFRQDHGYKNGTYQKFWDGEEDNEVLARLLRNINTDSESFTKDIYDALLVNYPIAK